MKLDVSELQRLVTQVIQEAKKKKSKKEEKEEREPQPKEYSYAEALDFSEPLGPDNRYARQGAANFGPYTGAVLHKETKDPWSTLSEIVNPSPPSNIWEAMIRWYDHMGYGLGKQTPAGIAEKKAKMAEKEAARKKKGC